MEIIRTIAEVRQVLSDYRHAKKVGLVPTMGYFHAGHVSLMDRARKDCSAVVTTLFVNPTQFGQGEDLDRYPRDEQRDIRMAQKAGVDILFAPDVKEMYPDGSRHFTIQPPTEITDKMCGASRPGHFQGVATVVAKLFNIIQPDKAYFGQKDFQQLAVIKNMANYFNMPVEIVGMPIIREADGLAMSSRNVYLVGEQRENALALYQTLRYGEQLIMEGELDSEQVRLKMAVALKAYPGVQLDYLEVLTASSLTYQETLAGEIVLAGAIRVGNTRLIDNIIMEV